MDHIVKYIQNLLDNSGPTVGYLGTCSAGYDVTSNFIFAFGVSEGPFRVTAYIPEAVLGQARQQLVTNDYAAILIVDANSYEGVQVKGPAIIRPGDAEGEAFFKMNIKRLETFYGSDMFKSVRMSPLIAVELTVKEIYNQTPGNGAGEPLKVEEGDMLP